MRRIYLVGSLTNPEIPKIGNILRADGHYVFDDWFSPGPLTDTHWTEYEKGRGRTYVEALNGHAAKANFGLDLRNLHDVDTTVLIMPAGKSGHLELGYQAGRGVDCHILLCGEPDKWDLMYRFAHGVWTDIADLRDALLYSEGNIER